MNKGMIKVIGTGPVFDIYSKLAVFILSNKQIGYVAKMVVCCLYSCVPSCTLQIHKNT